MKKIFVLLSLFTLSLLGFSQPPQASATSDVFATIIAPIHITKNLDMNFGNIASGNSIGTVILSPESDRVRTGGVVLPGFNGLVQASKFTVGGPGNAAFTYVITLPTTTTITKDTHTMIVNNFTSNPNGTGQLNAGSQELFVGATLNVGVGQEPGTYTGEYDVIVSFN